MSHRNRYLLTLPTSLISRVREILPGRGSVRPPLYIQVLYSYARVRPSIEATAGHQSNENLPSMARSSSAPAAASRRYPCIAKDGYSVEYDCIACYEYLLRDEGTRSIWSTNEYEYEGLGGVPGGKGLPEGGHLSLAWLRPLRR